MAYINFKEEEYVAKKQFNKRKNNNELIYKKILKNENNINMVSNSNYSFKIINEKTINNSKTQNEKEFLHIDNINIICATFIKCKFYNIKFTNCNFIGCKFKECDFCGGGVVFDNCSFFYKEIYKVPSLNKKDNFSCTFDNCNIYSYFFCCDISYLIFNKCYLKDTCFELTDMTSVIIINCELKKIEMIDVDLSGVKVVETYIEDFEFNDKARTKLNEKSFIDKIKLKEKSINEYEGLYMIYETIADKFKENNLNNNFGEYYFLCKNMQRKTLKKFSKISSYIYFLTCGYGERVLYPLISSIVIILIFAILYLFVGIDLNGEIIRYSYNYGVGSNILEIIEQFNESLNLSIGLFAGVGSNNSIPMSASYIISDLEMFIGTIMMGVGVGTLIRKIIR